MTTLTIIKDDSFVKVDGTGRVEVDCTSLASNVHAVQFDGTNGEIEYNDGTPHEAITSISAYDSIVAAHASAEETAEEATARFNALGYSDKRSQTYAEIGEQLDQQYHDAVNGTTTWKDAITAVKSAHPK